MLESLFNKVAGLQACNFTKETPTWRRSGVFIVLLFLLLTLNI